MDMPDNAYSTDVTPQYVLTVDSYTLYVLYYLTHMYRTYRYTLYVLYIFPVSHVEVSSSNICSQDYSGKVGDRKSVVNDKKSDNHGASFYLFSPVQQ